MAEDALHLAAAARLVEAAVAAQQANLLQPDKVGLDTTMWITAVERAWALEVKHAVESNKELEPLSDMWYAHHAIIAQGNLDEALRRIQIMQTFRQEYKINHSVEQAHHYLSELIEQQPGFLLNLDVDLEQQISVNAFDVGCFNPTKALQTDPKNAGRRAADCKAIGVS